MSDQFDEYVVIEVHVSVACHACGEEDNDEFEDMGYGHTESQVRVFAKSLKDSGWAERLVGDEIGLVCPKCAKNKKRCKEI